MPAGEGGRPCSCGSTTMRCDSSSERDTPRLVWATASEQNLLRTAGGEDDAARGMDIDGSDAGGLLVAEEILGVRTLDAVCRERGVLCRGVRSTDAKVLFALTVPIANRFSLIFSSYFYLITRKPANPFYLFPTILIF